MWLHGRAGRATINPPAVAHRRGRRFVTGVAHELPGPDELTASPTATS
jgi:hypothetical protein